jgi:ABC-type antimicrobial peptide transport system permease subunit
MMLFAIFGAIAIGLASLGLYGVLAYSVSLRSKEIGIRIALGAKEHDILALVVGSGMRLALLGVLLGLGASFGLTRLLSSLLFDVRANDPLIFITVPILLSAVAVVASYLPARNATKVDPIQALRAD